MATQITNNTKHRAAGSLAVNSGKDVTYIVAVSGGVDSVVLLHMLVNNSPMLRLNLGHARFVVAHVNHGIRGTTADRDAKFVEELASEYGLQFELGSYKLGKDASEEQARDVRYKFLESVCKKHKAVGVLLAHHADDAIETAIFNLLRGGGRRSVTALANTDAKIRPLLHMMKKDIYEYANAHSLKWVEDETNTDTKYARNKIRAAMSLTTDEEIKTDIAKVMHKLTDINKNIDSEIENLLRYKISSRGVVPRRWFVHLPHAVACEVMYGVLRKLQVSEIDSELIERLTIATKVALPGKSIDIDGQHIALLTKRSLRIVHRETGATKHIGR